MIREGKKAEFISCKQGKTVAPVSGSTKRPSASKVSNAEEYAETVKEAAIITAKLREYDGSAVVREIPQDSSCIREAEVQQAGLVTPLQHIACKNLSCDMAQKDITIKKLFHNVCLWRSNENRVG
ncbi:MAG: hypothetical protein HFH73_11600 [Lachnospiraceae bacterium]|jgi:hypothetical protein|nr:hypothetical protein [Lachnospiraceae bacterium]